MSAKILSILALVSTLCFVALLVLQALEFMYYKAPPSVWPVVP